MKRHNPSTKQELKKLCQDSSISLGDIDVSKITDMSEMLGYVESFNQLLEN